MRRGNAAVTAAICKRRRDLGVVQAAFKVLRKRRGKSRAMKWVSCTQVIGWRCELLTYAQPLHTFPRVKDRETTLADVETKNCAIRRILRNSRERKCYGTRRGENPSSPGPPIDESSGPRTRYKKNRRLSQRGEGYPANSVHMLRPSRMAPSLPGYDLTEAVPKTESSLARAERGKCPGLAAQTRWMPPNWIRGTARRWKELGPALLSGPLLPPRRLCSHPTSLEKRCLCRSGHIQFKAKRCRLAGKERGKAG